MIYEYPSIISYSKDDKVYYVDFPDMSNCFTDGMTLREALDNAEDALNTMLSYMEEQGEVMPTSSDLNSIKLGSGEIVALVKTDTASYSQIAV
ncbi:MAG: type II toxin-antitoxin system HicB family antitoxin [Synergistaceae bacterium]|nr:type II toxin-antitoxin system HicB family antitoxin [Synergistaceae bacterium]